MNSTRLLVAGAFALLLVTTARSAPVPPEAKKDPATWFKAAYFDPISLGELIKTFPKNSEWAAKAQLQIANLHAHSGTYLSNMPLQAQTAAKEYQSIIDLYPDQLDSVVQAKAGMATLYWDKLDQKDKAMELWKELKALGKLPPESPLARGARTSPVVLIRDTERTYGLGFRDFAISDDGSLYVAKAVPEKFTIQGRDSVLYVAHILRYSPTGSFVSTFTKSGIRGDNQSSLYLSRGQPYLKSSQKLIVMGAHGELKGELVNQFERFQFFPGGPNQSAGMGLTDQVPLGFVLEPTGFQAFYPNSLRKFNYSGDLMSKVSVDYCNRGEPNMVGMAENSRGEVLVAEPACGVVLRIGPEGVRSRITNTSGPEGTFSGISDMYLDKTGNSYILDVQGKSIIKYGKSGEFSNRFQNDAIDEYSRIAADIDGNIYLFGRPVAFGGAIIVLNAKGEELRRFNVKYDALGGMHKSVVDDLEVSKGRIYAAIDRYFVEFDADGKVLSKIQRPPMNWGRSGMRIAKDRKGRIAFLDRGQIYLVEGGEARLLVDFKELRRVGEPTEFGFDETGSIIVKGSGLFRYDAAAKTVEEIKAPKGVFLQSAVVNPTGGILASGHQLMGTPVIKAFRLSSSGELLATIESKLNAKKFWQPLDVAVDSSDNFYVYDQANKALLKFTPEGKPAGETPLSPYFSGWIQRIRIDRGGHLFVFSKEQDASIIARFGLADLY